MSFQTKALVISSRDSKDSDKEVTLLTLEKGRIYAKFKGVKNQKSKLKAGKEVFTFGDFSVEEGKSGLIVTGVNIIENFYEISQNIESYFEACQILDLLKKVPIDENNVDLFLSTIKALKALNCQKTQKNIVFFKFLIDFFENHGFKFDFARCSSCNAKLLGKRYINPDIGEIVCPNCKQNTYIEIDEKIVSAINILKNTNFDNLNSVKLGQIVSNELLSFLLKNFEWCFGEKIKILN